MNIKTSVGNPNPKFANHPTFNPRIRLSNFLKFWGGKIRVFKVLGDKNPFTPTIGLRGMFYTFAFYVENNEI